MKPYTPSAHLFWIFFAGLYITFALGSIHIGLLFFLWALLFPAYWAFTQKVPMDVRTMPLWLPLCLFLSSLLLNAFGKPSLSSLAIPILFFGPGVMFCTLLWFAIGSTIDALHTSTLKALHLRIALFLAMILGVLLTKQIVQDPAALLEPTVLLPYALLSTCFPLVYLLKPSRPKTSRTQNPNPVH